MDVELHSATVCHDRCVRLVFVMLIGCSLAAKTPAEFPPLPGEAGSGSGSPPPVATTRADSKCIPLGVYTVSVDLTDAKITQKNTGMDSTEWCTSMLQGLAQLGMSQMLISYEDDKLAIIWGQRRAELAVKSGCEFEITLPFPAKIAFANGTGSGTTTYTGGAVNHPDESCTATDAKIVLAPFKPKN